MKERESEDAGYAQAVRMAREAAGRDPRELAAALGVSYESYRDIEWYDDEITSSLSFGNVVTPTELLHLDLRRMFGADDTVVTFADLAAAVRTRLADTGPKCRKVHHSYLVLCRRASRRGVRAALTVRVRRRPTGIR
jgi:hypothetical protein